MNKKRKPKISSFFIVVFGFLTIMLLVYVVFRLSGGRIPAKKTDNVDTVIIQIEFEPYYNKAVSSIIEAWAIEKMGRDWNEGDTTVAKYISAIINLNAKNKVKLKPNSKILFPHYD